MPPPVDPLPILLAAAAGGGPRSGPRCIFGLCGEPGSGKSTLAGQLCAAVNAVHPEACVALSMDGYHIPLAALSAGVAGRTPEESLLRRGAPWTFHAAALCTQLRAVREGQGAVSWPAFDHAKGDPEEGAVAIPPSVRVVLLEGLYLLHTADGWEGLQGLLDATWWLGTEPEVSSARLLARHQQAWGISREEASQRIARNDALNAQLCQATMPRADGVIAPS
jgi:pantothenate kinase